MDNNPKNRQECEFEVLSSIYWEDIRDLRTGNKWKPLDIVISLKPLQGSISTKDIYATVDLHVTCTIQYPDQIPQIKLENGKGLSQLLLDQLRRELLNEARKHKGNEMIFELCAYVQEFLHKHNKPPGQSFYHQMQQRKEKEEIQHQEAKKIKEERETQDFNDEVYEIYSRLETRKKSNSESFPEENEVERRNSFLSDRRKSSSNDNSEDSQCFHRPVDKILFENGDSKQILRGKCLKHENQHSVYYGIEEQTGDHIIINEWIVNVSKSEVFQTSKQITHIEQEFSYVKKLRHKNLAFYYNISCFVEEECTFVIRILKEFVVGSNCRSLFITPNIPADIQFIKHIANGVLQALDYLHKKNVIHRDIKDSCIYINNKGVVKVSNYSIHRKVTDLVNDNGHVQSYNKKSDIYRFGLFILNILQGSSLSEDDENDIPPTLPPDLHDFLTKCLSKDEKDRFSANQLLNHQFFNEKPTVHFKLEEPYEVNPKQTELAVDMQLDIPVGSLNQSRINTEFEFIENIGEGAFGDVKKYRKHLDGRFYAIKKIKINPKNKQLNKKIVREVQYLSRLNHENVVRYYNSWIETSEVREADISSAESSGASDNKKVIIRKRNEFTLNDDIEQLAPPIKNAVVSITFDSKSQVPYEDSSSGSSDSSDDEENNAWTVNYQKHSDSDGVEFEHSKSTSDSINEDKDNDINSLSTQSENIIKIDYMYIQMEFCEKSTLKTAIDDNLYKDEPRVKRLFREILEGLSHIHQQGMIHRDLKPVNIFLDSKDHVKIGDFGLATTNLKSSKMNEHILTKSAMELIKEEAVIDESKTGHVGTPFYVAPELDVGSKANYNEKVDIYSLGVIVFEMCYRPITTAMERSKILHNLRQKAIVFPSDYESTLVGKLAVVIRWLLDHDTSKRPTSLEVLQSEHVPPPILEEKELMDLIRHTLSNPQSKGYKYLVASCFDQTISAAQDITYDRDLPNTAFYKPLEVYYEFVKEITAKVFKKHGGQNLSTPLLIPSNKFNLFFKEGNFVRLMTHDGGVVSLPYDLRVPFARYVAWNNISLFRRYSIERVYREKRIFGFVPRELYECAFDIVTPTPGDLMSDSEVLYVAFDIITQLPVLKDKTVIVHLNHTLLLRAILLYFGIKLKEHVKFIRLFSDSKDGKLMKSDFKSYLYGLGLSENQVQNLLGLLNNEFDSVKMKSHFSAITKKTNTECSQLAKQALIELKTIIETAQAMGLNFEICITPGLMYNTQQFSGMICQFVCEFKKRKHNKIEVLAAGGRYDAMISQYKNMLKGNIVTKNVPQSAVGISITLDKIAQAIQKASLEEENIGHFDVLICSIGNKNCLNEKIKILTSMSTTGLRWTILQANSMKEVDEHKEELKVPHVIILKENDEDRVILRSWEKDRFQENTYNIQELMDELPKLIKRFPFNYVNQDVILTRSDSKSYVEKSVSNSDSVTIFFYSNNEKIPSSTKKRYENQISTQLNDFFKRLTGNVIVLALYIEFNIIKTLAVYLEFNDEKIFQRSVDCVIDRHPRHKKFLDEICDVIYEHKMKPSKPFLILYSLLDTGYKILT